MADRMAKIEKEMQEVLGDYLVRNFHVSSAIVSIARVKMSKDLQLAKVYVSIFSPIEGEEKDIFHELSGHVRDMQSHIATKVRMKYTPKIHLFMDSTFEENFQVLEKLKNLGFNTSTPT